MKLSLKICVGLMLLSTACLWSQVDNAPTQAATANASDDNDNRMLTPPLVSGQSYPTSPNAEERSNYIRGGVVFSSAYTDNALGPVNGHPVSDVSYSVWPTLTLDETTPRVHWLVSYAPGFTFYQRTSSLNEADQNASINFRYRLSPHVTFSAGDGFQKSSNVFNQPDLASAGAVFGGTQEANFSVFAPIADRLSNFGNFTLTYQFAANATVGASGTFMNLHYPNPAQVPGLFDSSSQGGSVFYTFRVSQMHYIGVTYQYQRLLSFPKQAQNETQTQSVLFYYTLYPTTRFSISFFGGPQYADIGPQFFDIASTATQPSRSWNPAAGASLSWQGRLSSLAISYAHMISSGAGLIGAVRMDAANASIGQELSRNLSASVSGMYTQNDLLAGTPLFSGNGHTISGTASLQQQFGQHLKVQLGYTRLRQDYSSVAVLAGTPNTNREFVSVSYQFSRPLGR